jgi:RNA polymerase sigma-70 factor (ECF subfamily)
MPNTSSTTKSHAIRLAADGLQAANTGRLRRRTRDCFPDTDQVFVCSAVNAARQGDREALRFLYLRYADSVFSSVCSVVNDEHAAEDVTQTVFARLPLRLQHYQPGEAAFGTWITRVAYNASIDYLRAQRAVPCAEIHDSHEFREDVSADRLQAIRQALGALPDEQREVLVMRFVLGMKAAEIGERLGRSELAVHALQYKGRRRLREELVRLEAAPAVRTAA